MCNNPDQFSSLQALCSPLTVTLGDGHTLQAVGRGNVSLRMKPRSGAHSPGCVVCAGSSVQFAQRDVDLLPREAK